MDNAYNNDNNRKYVRLSIHCSAVRRKTNKYKNSSK